jgi:cobalt-zinc-cadmium resistance protein CzcA
LDRFFSWTLGWSIRRRVLVLVLGAVVAAFGAASALRLPLDAVPDITPVTVQVLTVSPSLSPVEIERQVTVPLEASLAGLPDLEEMRSLSKFGLSAITLQFGDGTPVIEARRITAERVAAAEIPEAAGRPELGPMTTGLGEVFQYDLEGEGWSLGDLRTVQDRIVRPRLLAVPGVAEVSSFGGFVREVHAVVDPERLRARGVPLDRVVDAIRESCTDVGGGFALRGEEQAVVRGLGRVTRPEEIGRVVVGESGGVPVTVSAVAEVRIGHEIRQGAVTRDGKGEVVAGIVMMRQGENSHEIVARVRAAAGEVEGLLPAGVRLVPFYDRSALIDRVLRTVRQNLAFGAILVVGVLLLLLGDLRAGIVVALEIPLVMAAAFMAMHGAGVAASLMSLGAIDFGLVVDSSVILVENAVRRLGLAPPGSDRVEIVRQAAVEVRGPTILGEVIIGSVYLPVLALEGVEGRMFGPMALTVIFALLASLVFSLTLMPALAATVLRRRAAAAPPDAPEGAEGRGTLLVRWARAAYAPVLALSLARPRAIVAAALLVLAGAGTVAAGMGAEFIPELDEGAVALNVVRLPSISLEASAAHSGIVERLLREEFPDEVETVVSKIGRAEVGNDPMGPELADVFVILKPREGWKRASSRSELAGLMAAFLAGVPGAQFSFSQPIELRMNELAAGVRADLAARIHGPDLEVLRAKAEEAQAVLRGIPGATGAQVEVVKGLPYLEVVPRRDEAARRGVSTAAVLRTVEALGGLPAADLFEGEWRVPVRVVLPAEVRDDARALAAVPVVGEGGVSAPLGEVATIREIEGPAQVSRLGGSRTVSVQCDVEGRDLGSFVAEARRRLAEGVDLPPGYRLEFGGQFEHYERARNRLAIVVPAVLLLVLLLLRASLGAFRPAVLVYSGIPFAAVGGVLALASRGMPLSISAAVGFIALFGVAVLNGLVLVSFVQQLSAEGHPWREAVAEGCRVRLRPVLITALVATLGFLPMAVSTEPGAEVQRPLATVVIGGLVTSTLLTLGVLPALLLLLGRPPAASK